LFTDYGHSYIAAEHNYIAAEHNNIAAEHNYIATEHNYIGTELKASVVLMTNIVTFFLSH
jgi:hypothetical protein